jgi:hypothetical protein
MDTVSGTLRDIHGLDSIPWWPLAPGWWVVAGIAGFLLLAWFAIRWWMRNGLLGNWRTDARRKLRELKKALPKEDPRLLAGKLSELLRRIAMARSGRLAAAGLTGESWLGWLAENDSSGFDWEKRGQILLVAPYMPPNMEVERKELSVLVRAALRWIDSTDPAKQRARKGKITRGKITAKSPDRVPMGEEPSRV